MKRLFLAISMLLAGAAHVTFAQTLSEPAPEPAWQHELATYVDELDPSNAPTDSKIELDLQVGSGLKTEILKTELLKTEVLKTEMAPESSLGLDLEADLAGYRAHGPDPFDGLGLGKGSSTSGCGCNCCCPGLFISGDYLNWSVERNDLAFAIFDPVGAGVPSGAAPVMSLDLGSQNGLRVGAGYRTRSGWELGAVYTYLRSRDNQAFAPGAGRVIAVQSSPSTGLVSATTAAASAEFQYDVIDFEAGHWFHTGDSVSLMVLGGLRYAQIDHRLQAAYNGGAFAGGLVNVQTDIDAFGGRVGGAAHWDVADRFSLFAKTAVSVLQADVNASRVESNGGAQRINATRPTNKVMSALEVSVGFRFYVDSWSIAAGYDWINWSNAVSPLEFSDSFNGGTLNPTGQDLGLHGFFVNSSYAW